MSRGISGSKQVFAMLIHRWGFLIIRVKLGACFFFIILMSTVVYFVPYMFMVWEDMDG